MALPTVPGFVEPGRRVDEREHAALGAPPVLREHRAPPLDHLVLGGRRDRRRAVEHGRQRRRVERGSLLVGHAQQAHAHRRHDVAVADGPLLDELQALALVPAGHDHQLAAVGQVDGREPERGGVVQRTGDEVRALAVEPEDEPGRAADRERLAEAGLPAPLHALGPAGGARGVEHRAAARPVERERARRSACAASASKLRAGDDHVDRALASVRGRPGHRLVLRVGERGASSALSSRM